MAFQELGVLRKLARMSTSSPAQAALLLGAGGSASIQSGFEKSQPPQVSRFFFGGTAFVPFPMRAVVKSGSSGAAQRKRRPSPGIQWPPCS